MENWLNLNFFPQTFMSPEYASQHSQPTTLLPAVSTHHPEKTGKAALTVDPVVQETPVVDIRKADFGFLPIPPSCRFNPDQPFAFNYWKTAVFALASTFSAFSHKNIPHFILQFYVCRW
jgi:hypothetical protein